MSVDQMISVSEGAANLKCKGCKAKGRRTYKIITTSWVYEGRPASSAVIEIGGRQTSVRDRYSIDRALWMPCPDCGSQNTTVARVNGTYSEIKTCNARCLNATGGDCECSCVGENHGKNNASW